MWKHKMSGLTVRLMKPFEEDGSSNGGGAGGGSDFDMSGAVDSIGSDLFGKSEPDANAPPADQNEPGGAQTPPAGDSPDPSKQTPIAPPTSPATPPVAAGTEPPKPLEAPKTWRPEAAAAWAALPPTVQAEVLKREEDMFKGIEGYKATSQLGQAFQQIAAPYQQFFQQTNTDPARLTNDLFQAHALLTLGSPEQKLAKLNEIASLYGVQMQPTDPDSLPYVDPTVKALQNELAAVKSQMSGQTQWQQAQTAKEHQRIRAELTSEVDKFSADPANIHFNDVANDIVQLLSTGVAKDLKDAYERAVFMNPVTREKEISRKATEAAEAQRKAAAEKAESARKAMGANVRTTAKQASGTANLGSMDDTLAATLASIKGRDK